MGHDWATFTFHFTLAAFWDFWQMPSWPVALPLPYSLPPSAVTAKLVPPRRPLQQASCFSGSPPPVSLGFLTVWQPQGSRRFPSPLRSRLRNHTPSHPPYSNGQSKSEGQLRSRWCGDIDFKDGDLMGGAAMSHCKGARVHWGPLSQWPVKSHDLPSEGQVHASPEENWDSFSCSTYTWTIKIDTS